MHFSCCKELIAKTKNMDRKKELTAYAKETDCCKAEELVWVLEDDYCCCCKAWGKLVEAYRAKVAKLRERRRGTRLLEVRR
jgi:hypothetical protein